MTFQIPPPSLSFGIMCKTCLANSPLPLTPSLLLPDGNVNISSPNKAELLYQVFVFNCTPKDSRTIHVSLSL